MARRPVRVLAHPSTISTLIRRNVRAEVGRASFAIAVASTIILIGAQPARAQDVQSVCTGAPLLSMAAGSSEIPSPCTVSTGSVLVETLYYQNASKVGGTALAGYPMLQLAAGVAQRVEIVFDPPSQIAESGLHGVGVFAKSHSSYGLRYRLSRTARIVFTAGFAVTPPASLYAPSEAQPKYLLDVNSAYHLTPGLTIKGIALASTSHTAGAGRVLPAQALGADISLSPSTVLSSDIGRRSVTARARAQLFGALSLKRSLGREFMFDMGLGTAFNPVAHAKAHYLSTGLSFQP
jgi:hypothetical protein